MTVTNETRDGNSCRGSGGFATATGTNTIASGITSTAMGYTTASGRNASALGATAQPYAPLATGYYNVLEGTSISWIDTDSLFVCGNRIGLPKTSNALALLENGNMIISETLTENSDILLKTEIAQLDNVLESIKT